MHDFTSKLTFQEIADKYHVSTTTVIKLFDNYFSYVPTGPLPEILCIDEIYFSRKAEYKYVCVLVDYKSKTIYDIIPSRQLPYLVEYFSKFSQNQLDKVSFLFLTCMILMLVLKIYSLKKPLMLLIYSMSFSK